MRTKSTILSILIALLVLSGYKPPLSILVDPVKTDINAKTKTLFIYNFTKYVEWPSAKLSGDFVIGVLGDYPTLLNELNKMASTKRVGSQVIKIVHFTDLESLDDCHIIFVSENFAPEISKITKEYKGKNTLLVSDQDGLAKKGSCINFYYADNKQKMEINPGNIEQHDLKVSSRLLTLAKVVE